MVNESKRFQTDIMNTDTSTGCGSGGGCQCATASAEQAVAQQAAPLINGIALHAPTDTPEPQALPELAWAELLRQRAVELGRLPAQHVLVAPALTEADRSAIEQMLDEEVVSKQPTEEECRRYFDHHKAEFTVGQAVHLKHILFAVTPGVNVQKLSQRAEAALLELVHKDVPAGRFAQLAAELSNCPSSAQGGDLGWVTPEECAPELAAELFHQTEVRIGQGVHARLVHSRYGFHVIEVVERRLGKLPDFEAIRDRIQSQLTLQSRATALRQYMQLLVGQAEIEGMALEGASSPLVQ